MRMILLTLIVSIYANEAFQRMDTRILQKNALKSPGRVGVTTKSTTWEEIVIGEAWSDPLSSTVGERLRSGESLVLMNDILNEQESKLLATACLDAAAASKAAAAGGICELEKNQPALVRLPTIAAASRASSSNTPCVDPLPFELDDKFQEILRRVTRRIDREIPSIVTCLFDGGSSLTELLESEELHFSSREPAVNVYSPGGEFLAHKDAQALTILIPISGPGDFEGGGTAFWSQDSRGHRVEEPDIVLKPEKPERPALLFGGSVTHAGKPVFSGSRVVFVASFSCKSGSLQLPQQRDIYGDSI